MSTIVIHVLRPYATEDEYLAHEAHTIDAKSMLLLDQAPLPADTAIVFDIQLQNGQKPIRAEARVVGSVSPSPGRAGGMRVRFKRFGAATKAFIDRAVAANRADGAAPPASQPTPAAAPTLEQRASSTAQAQREPSGIHRKLVAPVPAPANREELLERLRARARTASHLPLRERDERAG